MTLADEDNNSIPSDDVNRTIKGIDSSYRFNILGVGPLCLCIAILPIIAIVASSVGIELVSSSARVTSAKSAKPLGRTDIRTHRSDQGHLGLIKMRNKEKENIDAALVCEDRLREYT